MKEKDYINATNLAKARVAITTLRDTLFDDDSIKPEDIAVIGIACNDKYSNTFVKIMDFLKQ